MRERNSAFEIMRLLAMFMIILGHCAMATAKDQQPYLGTLDCIGWGIGAFTVCAVNLFFLLTGYFMNSAHYRFGRIVSLWLKTIFYSGIIYILYSIIVHSFSIKDCIGYFLPVLTKKYWYMQTYIVCALLIPFIAKGLEQLKTMQLNILIGILVTFFCLHQTFIKVQYTLDQTQGYGVIWACVMYIIGYWLRKNKQKIMEKPTWEYLGIYVLTSIAIFASNYLIVRWNIAGGVTSRGNFYAYNSVTVLVQSVCLFCVFVKASGKNIKNKTANFLAENCLAGYLISAHPLVLYSLWTDWLPINQYTTRPVLYIMVSIILSVVVLLICILIDKIVDQAAQNSKLERYISKLDDYIELRLKNDKRK